MNKEIKEKIKNNFEIALDGGTTLLGECLKDVLVAHIAPGVVTTYLSYKQKRTEKNIMAMLDELKNRLNIIEEHLRAMEEDEINLIKNKVFPMIFDFVIDEAQERKIKYIANGIENIIAYKITDEDLILTYFDVLSELRMIDLKELLYINNYLMAGNEVYSSSSEFTESDAVKRQVYIKLQKYNLIIIQPIIADFEGKEMTMDRHRAKISAFGRNFLKFILGQDKNHNL